MRQLHCFLIVFIFTFSLAQAAVTWTGTGDGSSWSNSGNWDTGVPSSSDEVLIYQNGATININTAAVADHIKFTDEATDNVTINLQSGSLTESGSVFSGRFAADSTTNINISGGTWTGNQSIYGPTTGAANFNVTGGTLGGYYRFRYAGTSVNVSGGILDMENDGTASRTVYFANDATLTLSGTGTMIFDAFANGDSETLLASTASDISGGTVKIRFNYTPSVGDTFDFLGAGFTVAVGGTNVSSVDADGLYNITWNLSDWDVAGSSKGVLTIDAISPVPEPETYALVLEMIALGGIFLRRRL